MALISFAISVVITGGLHIDGLMDTADGVGAGPSKRIEAMRDSRVGAIGVQSLVIILILQIAAIMKLGLLAPFAFPLAAFWGRLSQIFAIENYEYIVKKESLSFHHQHWKGLSNEIRPSLIVLSIGIVLFLYLTKIELVSKKVIHITNIKADKKYLFLIHLGIFFSSILFFFI